MKMVSNINNITIINHNKFQTVTMDDEVLYYKYHEDKPYNLLIMVNYRHSELVVEFTAKILHDNYISLINKNTIKECLLQINRMNICILDVDAILKDSQVVKCDVTKDIPFEDIEGIISCVKQNRSNYTKWIVKPYRKQGICLENIAKTPKHKKRLVIYDKSKELQTSGNNHFLNLLNDKAKLLSHFNGKVRFELNINTMEQIRSLLNIANNSLFSVLNSNANPILTVIDEAIKYVEVREKAKTLRDFERMLLLKECGYDMDKVESIIKEYKSKTTSTTRLMQPYRELCQQHSTLSSSQIDLRELVA